MTSRQALHVFVSEPCVVRSGEYAGARRRPWRAGLQAHRPEEEEQQPDGGRHHGGGPPAASQPLPRHHESARHGPGAHQAGGQAALLHHLCCHTEPPAVAQGHVLVEQRPADQVEHGGSSRRDEREKLEEDGKRLEGWRVSLPLVLSPQVQRVAAGGVAGREGSG